MSDSVGSVSVEVVPDARGWSEKLRAQIRDQKVTINADADTTEAETQLDEVARTRTAKIKTDVSQFSEGASKLDQFIGNLRLLPALAIAGGAALIPLAASLGGVVAALAAPLAIAGGGATLFALLGGAAVAQTQKQLKAITALQTKLAGLKKGTQEYADTAKELKAQQAALTPAQTQFASALDKVKGAFAGLLQGKNGQALLGPIASALALLAQVLPKVEPVIKSVGGAFSTLLDGLSNAAGTDGFKRMVDQFARLAGRDIVIGGRILGDLAKGVGGLLLATDKGFSGGFLRGIETLTSSFADWANSKSARKSMSDFFDYVHRVGPQVGDTIGAIARGVGHFVKALAPLGPPVLKIIQGLADAFNAIPIPVLTGIAGAAAGLVAFQKLGGFKATSLLTRGLGGGGGGVTGLLTGGVQKVFVVNMGAGGLGGGGAAGGGLFSRLGGFLGKTAPGAAGAAGLTFGSTAISALSGALVGTLANKGYVASHTNALLDGPLGFNTLADHIGSGAFHIGPKPAPTGFLGPRDLGFPDLRSTGTAFDALRQHAQQASQTIDQIGPQSHAAFASAQRDVERFNGVLTSIHDVRFQVIADTANAVRSLEHLQAIRINDKSFTVYQRNQILEQAVGPGGGIGRHNPGGSSGGSGGGASVPVHIHLDDNGKTTLSGYMQGTAQDTYDANQNFARHHG